MKAVRIHEFGGPEVLKLEDVPGPSPCPGEVLIEVRGASVNPVDYKIREGKYPAVKADQLPLILGRDVAGVITEIAGGVDRFRPGDEVFAFLPIDRGGYAEQVAVPARACAKKPRVLDMAQAASVPLAALTAWQGLFEHGKLQPGQRVLIHGASGGVGHFAVQFARFADAEVFATASGPHLEFVRRLGARQAIDYKAERFEDIVHDADLVYDMVGGDTQARSWQVLRRGGTLVSTLEEPDRARAEAAGVRAMRYTAHPDGEQLAEIAALIDAGRVKVCVERVFPLEEAADAEVHLEEDHVAGKVVLAVPA